MKFVEELQLLMKREAEQSETPDDAATQPCDVIYLYRNPMAERFRLPDGVAFGQPDGDEDEHGWLTVGYSWMGNAYLLSEKAMKLIVESDYKNNLLFTDDILPLLYSISPLKNLEAYGVRSGLGNKLRACECRTEKCLKLYSSNKGIAEAEMFGSGSDTNPSQSRARQTRYVPPEESSVTDIIWMRLSSGLQRELESGRLGDFGVFGVLGLVMWVVFRKSKEPDDKGGDGEDTEEKDKDE
eukprot:gnl/MRDRNA2_/MRDRNA2_20498_c0_seq2.p1 gnl/MRDRNA2_/MRDRNA2_20498_c0~~gnl/MRDRNA2_/MRDRNA2_20498_c0_seq2.p1  ORF type:complete len:240 (+),score=53.81 gnl/MRDRNA2_/MRDRNA2_20498_c0_seq2:244-963(+)